MPTALQSVYTSRDMINYYSFVWCLCAIKSSVLVVGSCVLPGAPKSGELNLMMCLRGLICLHGQQRSRVVYGVHYKVSEPVFIKYKYIDVRHSALYELFTWMAVRAGA